MDKCTIHTDRNNMYMYSENENENNIDKINNDNNNPPKPWICSCFTSKAFACMMDNIKKDTDNTNNNSNNDNYNNTNNNNNDDNNNNNQKINIKHEYLFWQTKSNVQPFKNKQTLPQSITSLNKNNDIGQGSEFLIQSNLLSHKDIDGIRVNYLNKEKKF